MQLALALTLVFNTIQIKKKNQISYVFFGFIFCRNVFLSSATNIHIIDCAYNFMHKEFVYSLENCKLFCCYLINLFHALNIYFQKKNHAY